VVAAEPAVSRKGQSAWEPKTANTPLPPSANRLEVAAQSADKEIETPSGAKASA